MADVTITGLPNATVPLSGNERVPMDQDGTTVDASTQAIADLCGGSITAAFNAHVAAADPHPGYLTPAEGDAAYEAAGAVAAHVAAADPHEQYLTEAEGDGRYRQIATAIEKGDVGLGNVDNTSDVDKPISSATQTALAALLTSLQAFRDANRVYVSPRGNDANNGTSEYEPLRTLGAAALWAQPGDLVVVGPGVYTEAALPIRWKRNVGLLCSGLRNTTVRPAAGQEMAGIFRVDSGFWCWGLEFAGHQANSATGDLSWAISFDELADNTSIGASGLGAYILKSPYIQNCSSITAEDDAGTAGSVSTGDTGGGIKVDGNACASNSPIRSMVVDSYTQVNLGGPGCLVLNDGYAQLVSFFGTFCTYHVRTESGGQVNLSGGGTSDFGIYGLMADGYSPRPVFTGTSRIASYGAARIEKAVTIDATAETFACTAHGLSANDQVVFSASQGTLPAPLTTGTTYFVRAAGLTADAFTVSATSGGAILDITGATTGTYSVVRQGVTEVDVVGFGANRLGGTVSRPSAGQLMFPQLVFPRNASTEVAEAKTFTYTKTGTNTLTFTEATSATGPDHEYVSGGTVVIGGTNYGVVTATYDKASGLVTVTTVTTLPGANGSTGSVTVNGLVFICPTSAYVVTSSIPIDASGDTVANDSISRAGYRVLFFSGTNGGLRNPLAVGQVLDFRQRSQISAPSHTFEYVGAGTNYNALPWNGGVPVPANKIVETNNGRVYSSNTDELGNFAVGSQFNVDGTTGSVTINTDQFDLSGLNFIGPFSRNGGISTVGEQLREVSNNTSLLASTGGADGNTAPTQFAVKTYVDNKFLQGLTVTAGQPISVSDTSTVDGQGFQTRNRNISISAATPSAAGTMSAGDKLKLDGIEAGAQVNVGTDLSYAASSRLLASSTGADVTLPEATTTNAGLQSAADKTKLDSIVVDSATLVRKFVRNNSGVSIPKGAPVYATGSSGTTLTVALADASVEATSSQTLGLAQETIGINANGYVVAVGLMDGISTETLTEGQIVWLSETTGQLTTTRPTQPAHGVVCGYCVKQGAGASGILYVKVDNGQELNELHDVLISGVSTGQVLRRASDGLWKNHTPVAADISDSTAAGRALVTAADADAQRTALGLGTLATQSGTFSGTSSGTNTGDVTLATSLADILSLEGQELSADDPGGDRLLFWDDSASKLTHLSVGPGIVFDGTTLRAEASPWMALGDEPTAATSGVKLTVRHWPQSDRLTAVPLWDSSAPVGSALQIDIRIAGTSIFNTLPTIAVGEVSSTTTTAAVFSTAFVSGGQTIPAGSVVTFLVTQAPSGGGGAGLKVQMPAVRV